MPANDLSINYFFFFFLARVSHEAILVFVLFFFLLLTVESWAKIVFIIKWILSHLNLFFHCLAFYLLCESLSWPLLYNGKVNLLNHILVSWGSVLCGKWKAWKKKVVKQGEIGAEKWSGSCLLIPYKGLNNLNGDLEVTHANEKLDRKVLLFSFCIHIYQSKRCISRLWFCQHKTIFTEKCVHLLAVSYQV